MRKLLMLFSLSITALMAQTATGNISGTVIDDTGAIIPGALVTIVPPFQKGVVPSAPPFVANTMSDTSGAYQFHGVPPGTYTLCAQLESGGFLNPCVWSNQPTSSTVLAGSTVSGVNITMQRGATVNVHLNDPLLLLNNSAKDDVLIGIRNGTSPFQLAKITSKASAGRIQSLVVPAGQNVPIYVYSSHFAFANSSGAALPTAAAATGAKLSVINVNVPKGQQTNVTVQVSAAAAP